MNTFLTDEGYQQAKEKLARLEERYASAEKRNDLTPLHKREVLRSYDDMRRQYERNIGLYDEARAVLNGGVSVKSRGRELN
jgi:hypothetical protein